MEGPPGLERTDPLQVLAFEVEAEGRLCVFFVCLGSGAGGARAGCDLVECCTG